jgi:hypothetical protein
MEFDVADHRENANACIYDLLEPARKAEIQAVMDADMANPFSQRYGGFNWAKKWTWGAEGRLCLAYSPNPIDFSSMYTNLGGWFEGSDAGTTADELFSIVPIAKDAAAYDPINYTSSDVDYLVLRMRAIGSGLFSWVMPDSSVVTPFLPTGEVLNITGNTFVVKWREIGWVGGDVYQKAAYLLDGNGLKIKWGNFAGSEISAAQPTLNPAEACNDTNIICYDHQGRPGF